MRINSDEEFFDAVIAKAAAENIDELNDYGENDPFTETEEFQKMMDEVYSNIKKELFSRRTASRKKIIRRTVVVAAVIIAITALLTANVSAFRIFLYKTYMDVRGDILNVSTDTEELQAEYESIVNFKQPEKLIFPKWLPKGTVVSALEDNKNAVLATYCYNDNIICFSQNIITQNSKSVSKQYFLERSDYITEIRLISGTEVYITILEGDTGNISNIAVWGNDDIKYTLKVNGSNYLFEAVLNSLVSQSQ